MAGPRGRGHGRPGDRADAAPARDAADWFAARVPGDWFTGPPEVIVDRDEITVIGDLAPDVLPVATPTGDRAGGDAAAGDDASGRGIPGQDATARGASDHGTVGGVASGGGAVGDGSAGDPAWDPVEEAARIRRFRERTRDERIAIAADAERRYGRRVAWGATTGSSSELFTVLSVPVMTRLRQPERQVLDILVDSGVARSRSEALAWCVRLVGENADVWLRQLREAMEHVEKIRSEGPGL
jgi:hypothetical protein